MNNVTVSEVPADAQIIDVREPSEYAQGHAQGAINIPLGSVVERSGELDTSRDVYVICQLGGRSAKAAEALESHLKPQSFTIHNISGGTEAWIAAGLHSRSRSQPAFACRRTATPRQAPPRSPVERGLPHCRTIRFRPSLTGNHINPASHTSLRNPQNPRPVCCDIACFEPRFASWREISQHTTRARARTTQGSWRVWVSTVLRYLQFRL